MSSAKKAKTTMAKPTQPAAAAAPAVGAPLPPPPVAVPATPPAAPVGSGLPPSFTGLPAIQMGVAIPAAKRTFGQPGEASKYTDFLKSFAAPAADGSLASAFFAGTEAPATVTDAKEREKAYKESVRKLANSLTGAARRIVNADATYNFTTRTVTENDILGIRIFRIAPEPVAPAAPAAVVPPPPVA